MLVKLRIMILLFVLFAATNLYANLRTKDYVMFNKIFASWTKAFNEKNLTESCALFSKSVTADYRGFPTKNYSMLCDGFKKIFSDVDKHYVYDYKLQYVYRSGNFAAARITWYLHIYKDGKLIETIQDEGLDIFEKNQRGKWEIINYLSYPI